MKSGIFTIFAYKGKQCKKIKFGITTDTNDVTEIYDRYNIVEIFVEATSESEALDKARLYIDRPFYDVVRIQEKLIEVDTVNKPGKMIN